MRTRLHWWCIAAVGLAVLLYASRWLPGRTGAWPAGDSSIYSSPLVTPAPENPLPLDAGSFRFEDARGVYEHHVFGAPPAQKASADSGLLVEQPYVNLLFTTAGHKRSGDIHKCEQLNHILFGDVLLTRVLRKGSQVTTRHRGGDVIRVPPHVPHLYAYTSDTLMSETWRHADGRPCEFKAWFYKPLRDRIPAASADKRFTRDDP
jgi:hypothetical protein